MPPGTPPKGAPNRPQDVLETHRKFDPVFDPVLEATWARKGASAARPGGMRGACWGGVGGVNYDSRADQGVSHALGPRWAGAGGFNRFAHFAGPS